jgi:hypothetical protein
MKTYILTIVKDPLGATVSINDAKNVPIIGMSFETVTDDALSDPNPPSRHKKRLREEASARYCTIMINIIILYLHHLHLFHQIRRNIPLHLHQHFVIIKLEITYSYL